MPTTSVGASTEKEDFNKFYAVYPKKKGKQEAQKAWNKLKPDNLLLEKILKALELQLSTIEWKKERGKFIPYPATWLNQRRWEDEISPHEIKPKINIIE